MTAYFPFCLCLSLGATLVPEAIGAAADARPEIPSTLTSFNYNDAGKLTLALDGQSLEEAGKSDPYTLTQMLGAPVGTETGVALDFAASTLNGTIAYGPIDTESEYPTVAFLPKTVKLAGGKATLEFKSVFKGANDFFALSKKGKGVVGFRVLDGGGRIIYEGRVAFRGTGPYEVVPTVVEGPFINELRADGCTVSYETQVPVVTAIKIGERKFAEGTPSTHHELTLSSLLPATAYNYELIYADRADKHAFRTAPSPGARTPFAFAFASANRATTGGGEREFGGTNFSSSRAVLAAAVSGGAVFMQASGDITTGENTCEGAHLLEYANWKRALEPFWSGIPVYVGFGDHEDNFSVLRETRSPSV